MIKVKNYLILVHPPIAPLSITISTTIGISSFKSSLTTRSHITTQTYIDMNVSQQIGNHDFIDQIILSREYKMDVFLQSLGIDIW